VWGESAFTVSKNLPFAKHWEEGKARNVLQHIIAEVKRDGKALQNVLQNVERGVSKASFNMISKHLKVQSVHKVLPMRCTIFKASTKDCQFCHILVLTVIRHNERQFIIML
jgi:hydrogenase maturation factor HypE